MATLMLVGATGLVGSAVLRLALDDARVERIVAPTRRRLVPHPRLDNPLVDFGHLPAEAAWWPVDAVICSLGTTIRVAGSQDAFRKVDLDYTLAVARLARRHGARAFAFNSAVGANPASRFFYNRVKGEAEQALRACAYPSLTIVRPALLGGERAERRPAEQLSLRLLGALRPLVPSRYRIVPAERVARRLLEAALAGTDGVHIVESENI